MKHDDPKLFALDASHDYGVKIARHMGIPLAPHEEREFEDGEHKARPLENVRGRDVFVVQSLYGDAHQSVNDKLCRLLFFLGALKDADAARVTAVIPYLCYTRKDRRTQARDPVTTRYTAALFEALNTDHVVTMDVHNLAAFHNAFRCSTDHLQAKSLFVDYFADKLKNRPVAVISPDAGGVKRTELFRQALSKKLNRPVGAGIMEKHRDKTGVGGAALIGNVKDKTVIIVDDLISTGGTLSLAVRACHRHGAAEIHAAVTHGLFVGEAGQVISDPLLKTIAVTDTIPPFRLEPQIVDDKVVILDAAAEFAAAVQCIHTGESLARSLED